MVCIKTITELQNLKILALSRDLSVTDFEDVHSTLKQGKNFLTSMCVHTSTFKCLAGVRVISTAESLCDSYAFQT